MKLLIARVVDSKDLQVKTSCRVKQTYEKQFNDFEN